ncbi:MAG: PQQ-like beta-propeller repeat protein [Planctomycetes bacterium]|nr:PQQ-like beta-propeller repeat protein [Planctomycetota bacterium]
MSTIVHGAGAWSARLMVSLVILGSAEARAQWTQWGGPKRDFSVDVKGLADKWPEDGPHRLWTRELGDGYSTITVDDGKLYTMYRIAEDELVVCLDAKTGKTLWEHKYAAPFTKEMAEFGPGPHSTPLIVGEKVFTVGADMVLLAFEKSTGKIVWQHDLAQEFKATVPGRGYSCSPVAYKDTIIVPVGGPEDQPGQAVVAFKQSDGSVAWKNQSFEVTHSSPILINFAGEDQLVVFMAKELAGLNPANGELLWTHAHPTQYGANLSTPVWDGQDTLFCSAAYDSGSRAVRLVRKEGKTVPEELWFSKKVRIHHGNAVHIGDHVYGSSGDFGPAFFFGVNLKTGELAWRERGFTKATCVAADGKVVILDEDGQLALATASPKGLTVLSKCQLLKRTSWAAPTLAGTTLYIRDRKSIMALDLS